MIQISYKDPRPIYEQVRDSLRRQILAGILVPDEKLPSVRELATELAINPNTIQRAYRELEHEGCVYSVRGKGSFVADASVAQLARRQELLEQFDGLVKELESLGCTREVLLGRLSSDGGPATSSDPANLRATAPTVPPARTQANSKQAEAASLDRNEEGGMDA
jgi:GntR family transcriptional regulator